MAFLVCVLDLYYTLIVIMYSLVIYWGFSFASFKCFAMCGIATTS